jgi:hypothetical protein
MDKNTQFSISIIMLCVLVMINQSNIDDLKKTVTKLNNSTQCKNDYE